MNGKLTTHVLDTAKGCPAAGITILLRSVDCDILLKSVITNADGRTVLPLLSDVEMKTGNYELVFLVGDYFTDSYTSIPFLNRIPIQFGIGDCSAHYHIPLLVSPWAYSTYRGS
jgi:5-hydroxyisourate hydrolase